MITVTILPPFPKALQALANDRQPALTTTEIIQNLRQSQFGGPVADAIDRLQQYADSNGNFISLIVRYLAALTVTVSDSSDDTLVTIDGVAVYY